MVGRGMEEFAAHAASAATEPSVEALSTTTTRAGPGAAAAMDSRQAMVSTCPFQLRITTPIDMEPMVR